MPEAGRQRYKNNIKLKGFRKAEQQTADYEVNIQT